MKSVPNLLFFKPMKEPPTVFPFGPIAELIAIPKRPYLPGEKCYVRETWCRGTIEQADRGDESYLGDFYVGPGNDVIFKQYCIEHNVGIEDVKWLSPIALSAKYARRFVVILSCEPVRVEEVTEEDCKRMGVNWVHEFICDWLEKHPGKEWAWRVVSQPSGITG